MLKLAALDEEDLKIISAHVQDAVMKTGELTYLKREKQFTLAMRRFAWEKEEKSFFFSRRPHERRLSALTFNRVFTVRSSGIDIKKPDEVLSLLAIRFLPGERPSGTIELDFSGNATIQLDVECIEVRLTDLGAAWETPVRPRHSN